MEDGQEQARETPPKENSGEYLWRVWRPAGCIAALLLFIAFLVFCFTWRGPPAEEPAAAAETAQNYETYPR